MITLDINTIATAMNASLHRSDQIVVKNYSTDSRESNEQGIFFALRGERFDAHQFLTQALAKGAVALVVEHYRSDINAPQLVVKDTKIALGDLARLVKSLVRPKTIAITGSAGKTTVKEICAHILRIFAGEKAVLATKGNLNNDVGVPMTLLNLAPHHQFAVIEHGASSLGEIAYTAHICQADIALVNNVTAAHLQGFGSLLGVIEAKAEIYQALPAGGKAVISDEYFATFKPFLSHSEQIIFSLDDNKVAYHLRNLSQDRNKTQFQLVTPQGMVQICLKNVPLSQVKNALAAATLCAEVGASLDAIAQGIESFAGVQGRLEPIALSETITLINDTYNANLASYQTAIDLLEHSDGERILIAGDMAELGDQSLFYHQEVGKYVMGKNIKVYSFGRESRMISLSDDHHFDDMEQLCQSLQEIIRQKNKQNQKLTLLFKGSRSMKMERAIKHLLDNYYKESTC